VIEVGPHCNVKRTSLSLPLHQSPTASPTLLTLEARAAQEDVEEAQVVSGPALHLKPHPHPARTPLLLAQRHGPGHRTARSRHIHETAAAASAGVGLTLTLTLALLVVVVLEEAESPNGAVHPEVEGGADGAVVRQLHAVRHLVLAPHQLTRLACDAKGGRGRV
jgi:hypothetical protein